MKRRVLWLLAVLVTLWVRFPGTASAQEQAVVRAVLIYSPTCPHCHYVINEVLPPLLTEYGDQLQILAIDATQPAGGAFFQSVLEYYQVPEERRGVPFLIVGDTTLVGSVEIEEQFPAIIEEGLSSGGIDWPDVPGLDEFISAAGIQATEEAETASEATPAPEGASPGGEEAAPSQAAPPEGFRLDEAGIAEPPPDPVGMALAGTVLIGMIAALGYTALRIRGAHWNFWPELDARRLGAMWPIPLLVVAGLIVASYLSYVEITQTEAICGPVGECNIVQSSPYARIAGVPVAVLGLLSYLAIGLLWLAARVADDRRAEQAALALLGLATFGTLFSIYLTALEIFTIRAVCSWCLSSAVITTLLMLLAVAAATHRREAAPLQT